MQQNELGPVSRRRFLGTTAVAAAGLATGGIATGIVDHRMEKNTRAAVLAGQFFRDPVLDFHTQIALGSSYYGCGNPGKLFAIISRIEAADVDSAYLAFFEAGRETQRLAEESLQKAHPISARSAFLWAANYFYTALYFLDGSSTRVAGPRPRRCSLRR